MSKHKRNFDEITGTETTGHEWDGIDELDTPMPRWWLGIFYACILWAGIYAFLMPAIPALPGMEGYTKGKLGFSDRARVAVAMDELHASRAVQAKALVGAKLKEIQSNPDLMRFATAQGKSLFGDNCAICHGEGGQGSEGYPNLNDDIWIWGGSYEDIKQTLTHGIRADDDDSRIGDMLAFGRDEILASAEIDDLVQHVLNISGQTADVSAALRGASLFADNCASCHGDNAKGTRELGAPDLTDQNWLYGGDVLTIRNTIFNGRGGLMPNWNARLTDEQIAALSVYVHALGGGE
ncbi:MAG: cytochrome-c oxidase, cbb3-type subunit III [Robiginitomaculum sp.]